MVVKGRLVINLEKTKRINQAIQLCEIILSPRFTFSKHSYRTNEGFKLRYSKLIKKLAIADDTPDDILFTDNEKELIYKRSKYTNRKKFRLREICIFPWTINIRLA